MRDTAYDCLRKFADACDADMEILAGPPTHDAPYLSLSDLEAVLTERDDDVRAVAALLKLGDVSFRGTWQTDFEDAKGELEARFADRIAALEARDAKAGDQ